MVRSVLIYTLCYLSPGIAIALDSLELIIPIGHTDAVTSIEFSPDGRSLLSASSDGTAIVWDVASMTLQQTLYGHNGRVNTARYSTDGRFIVTASMDHTCKLWDRGNGRLIKTFHTSGPVMAAKISTDNRYVMTDQENGWVSVWEIESEKITSEQFVIFHDEMGYENSCFLNEGDAYVVFSDQEMYLSVSATAKKKVMYEFQYSEELELEPVSYEVSDDGRTIFMATGEDTLMVLDASDGSVINKIHIPRLDIFRPMADEQLMLAGSNILNLQSGQVERSIPDRNIRSGYLREILVSEGNEVFVYLYDRGFGVFDNESFEWRIQKKVEIDFFGGDFRLAKGRVAMNKDGSRFAVVDKENQIRLWNLNDGTELGKLKGLASPILSSDLSGDETFLLSVQKDRLIIWDFGRAMIKNVIKEEAASFIDARFTPDEGQIAATCQDSVLRVYDRGSGRLIFECESEDALVKEVFFVPKRKEIITVSYGGRVSFWHSETGRLLEVLSVKATNVVSADLSKDNRWLVMATHEARHRSRDRFHTSLIDLESLDIVKTVTHEAAYAPEFICNAFDPHSRYLIASWNGGYEVYDLDSFHLQFTESPHQETISDLAFSSDQRWFVTGSLDGYAYLGNRAKGKVVGSIWSDDQLKGVKRLLFSEDSKTLGILYGNNSLSLWELNDKGLVGKEPVAEFDDLGDELTYLDFLNDSRHILTSSMDGSVRLIDQRERSINYQLTPLADASRLIFFKDGYYSSSKEIVSGLKWKVGSKYFSFDQFDLKFNRPDIVLDRLGAASPDEITLYYNAYSKRLEKLGVTIEMLGGDYDVPEIRIENKYDLPSISTVSSAELSIRIWDSHSSLALLNVWVNNVPYYGIRGNKLTEMGVDSMHIDLGITLSRGKNKIQVSALNSKGAESLKDVVYINYTGKAPEPVTHYIGIGVSNYRDSTHNLTYAAKDVEDLTAALKEQYPNLVSYTFIDKEAKREDILAVKEELLKTNVDDRVILSLSGHGVLDDNLDFYYATHDMDFEDPAARGLLYDDIEWLLDSIPARKKLVLLDACHSGEVDKEDVVYVDDDEQGDESDDLEDGVKERAVTAIGRKPKIGIQNSFTLMQELFADLSRGNGAVVISAAGGLEYAFEDDRWSNGVFTYSVLRGLEDMEADKNDDGEVTVSELKAFVSEEVQRLTKGRQKPTSRQENLEFDFVVW